MTRSRLAAFSKPALLLLLGSSLAGCVSPWPTLKDPKAGFIYVGPVVDHGWTLTHDVSRLYLEDELGIETQFADSVIPADAATRMEEFIASGDNVIITTSFDFLSETQEVAQNNPDVNFLNCSGFSRWATGK